MANEYGTITLLKARLGITDATDDAILTAVLEAVSREVDNFCGRHFYGVAQTRYYTPENSLALVTDDLTAITTLKTDEDGDRVYERTWATTDYDKWPYNALLESSPRPFTELRVTPRGLYSFPVGMPKSVELNATFGYVTGASTTAPPVVLEATLLQSERMFKRKDAIFGVVGSAELGQLLVIPKLDSDVMLLLYPLKRVGLLVS